MLPPIVLSFEKKIQFYKKYFSLFLSIIIVGSIFIIWDSIATVRGDWSFNDEYILGVKYFDLPVEEILFFISVPFASIFLYETIKLYFKPKERELSNELIWAILIIFIVAALRYYYQYYTSTVLIFCAVVVTLNLFNIFAVFASRIFWIWIGFMYLPFFVVNYILTSLPIVTYSPQAIWGIRLLTIPLEDFFYSFSMLSSYMLVYNFFETIWSKKISP